MYFHFADGLGMASYRENVESAYELSRHEEQFSTGNLLFINRIWLVDVCVGPAFCVMLVVIDAHDPELCSLSRF